MLLLVLGWGRAPGHWAGTSAGPQPFPGLPSAELPLLASPSPHPRPACTSLSASVISLLCSPPWARLCLGATGRLPMCTVGAATPTQQTRLHGYMVPHVSSSPAPAMAPGSKRFRAQNNQARPRTAPSSSHPQLTQSFRPKGELVRQK